MSATSDERRDAVLPACLQCGACCFSQLPHYVRVTGADYARLGARENVDALTHFDGNRCYMNMQDGHCAALTLDLQTRQFVCSVYETRPSTCRDLERGSAACRAEIHAKSQRPSLLLGALRARR
ncbi:MAG TPA: YkgJ family cysteine cluster protein [Polyangiaceae bacterium]|nr:YkgJ family cysteine cluster protein [Polyangiaceae bacterium]